LAILEGKTIMSRNAQLTEHAPLRIRIRLFAAAFLLSLLFLAGAIGALADGAEIFISPPAQAVPVGQQATISIAARNVQNAYAAQVTLRYDPTIIEVLSIEAGNLFAGGSPVSRVDNEGGTALFAITLLNPAPPANGDGTIAVLTVRGKMDGGTAISLEALISNPQGIVLPSTARGGTIDVGQILGPTSTPAPPPPLGRPRPPARA
jgi:hypothetical protein